jgi:hypothetical protein
LSAEFNFTRLCFFALWSLLLFSGKVSQNWFYHSYFPLPYEAVCIFKGDLSWRPFYYNSHFPLTFDATYDFIWKGIILVHFFIWSVCFYCRRSSTRTLHRPKPIGIETLIPHDNKMKDKRPEKGTPIGHAICHVFVEFL